MGNLEVIVGGQFGSEGKGAITAWRSQQAQTEDDKATILAMRVAGPNAGHTVIGEYGVDTSHTVAPNLCEHVGDVSARRDGPGWSEGRFAWRLRQVPVAAVSNPAAPLALSAGSEIDLDVLVNEVVCLDAAGYDVSSRLFIDHEATLIVPDHKDQERVGLDTWYRWGKVVHDDTDPTEAGIATILGSTGKGVGAARADRIWRRPAVRLGSNYYALDRLRELNLVTSDTAQLAQGILRSAHSTVLVEGTQGYGLGLRAGFYPFCTSSDCRAIDFLSMAGISPWQHGVDPSDPDSFCVWVCLRPYPIRVGGNSGPLAHETDWETLGLPTEHTTVTNKVRRVGLWDGKLARQAIQANGGPGGVVKVALTMVDTLVPEVAGWTDLPNSGSPGALVDEWAAKAETLLHDQVAFYERECQQSIAAVGTGPDTVLALEVQDPLADASASGTAGAAR